jgi:DNA-directed RNA polymerase subunit B
MEDLAPNRVIIDLDEKGTAPVYQAKIFSTTVGFRARIELKLKADNAICVSMPGVPTEIPFIVLMRALSLEKDKDIAEAVSLDRDIQAELGASFEKAMG